MACAERGLPIVQERRRIANEAVSKLQAKLHGVLSKTGRQFQVHWDDCDMEERRFWVHIRVPEVLHVTPRDPRKRELSAAVREAIRGTRAELNDENHQLVGFDLLESPVARYRRDHYRKFFHGYEGDTWIYRLWIHG